MRWRYAAADLEHGQPLEVGMCMQCVLDAHGGELNAETLAGMGEALAAVGREITEAASSGEPWLSKLETVHDCLAEAISSTVMVGPAVLVAMQLERIRIAASN